MAKAKVPEHEGQPIEHEENVTLESIDVPTYFVGTFQISVTGTEVLLTCSAPTLLRKVGQFGVHSAKALPQTILQMSPQAAKDLLLLLGPIIAAYEKDWGEIHTPYMRRLAAEQHGKQKKSKSH